MDYHHQGMTQEEIHREYRRCLAGPTPGDFCPKTNPRQRPASAILAAYKANLLMARDCTALRLATLKSGSSSWKTTAGMLRAFNECLDLLKGEMGESCAS